MRYISSLLFCLYLSVSTGRAADVIISEFMASNGSTLLDEDGQAEDWIEILNVGTTNVDLRQWALTDDSGDLTKWEFPATNLLAGEFMVIFASGKDRDTPGAELHTSFRLGGSGEYLALVRPDGSIATEFSPEYPGQVQDVSFGFSFEVDAFTLMPAGSVARVHVPADGGLGTSWTAAAFDDSSWLSGVSGVGYDTEEEDPEEDSIPFAVMALAPAVYLRFSETAGATAVNAGTLGSGANGTYLNATLNQAGPRPPEVNGFEVSNIAPRWNGTSTAVTTGSDVLNGRPAFSVGGWVRPAASQGTRTGLFGQNDAVEFGFISATTVQVWTPNGGSLNVTYPFPAGQWHHIMAVGDGSVLRVYFDGVEAGSGGVPTANYGSSGSRFNVGGGGIFDTTTNFFNGHLDEVVAYPRALTPAEVLIHAVSSGSSALTYASHINLDVESIMNGVNSTIYMRFPFNVADPSTVDRLTLEMQYDDGFVAYLNGVRVAGRNAPLVESWNDAATERHADGNAVLFESINISSSASLLQPGGNVLAVQGLNIAPGNTDFLVTPRLTATSVGNLSTNDRYFVLATPGGVNGIGTRDLGPIIGDVGHSPQVPGNDEDLLITVEVAPAFNPIAAVAVNYLVMFGGTSNLALFDDGLHGDGGSGDGVYGNTIPVAALSQPGQMIRYYVTASDAMGNLSRWPLYEDQAVGGSEEYLGTVVRDDALTSKLPIFELFVAANQLAATDTEGGGRVAVFHDGELYDNVFMELRGNTTAGYLKKSHRLEYPRDHRLRHVGERARGRVRNTSFTADYGDPSYMRQGLSFWLAEEIGCPAPYYYPVRLQRNQQFYQLANHNNVIRGEILDYLGYDEGGALYRAVGTVQTSQFSTGGFSKRTRQEESNADYQALASGIDGGVVESTRRINAFDMLDVPTILNYVVTGRWVHENDDVWANMSLYRDTEGDGLWRCVPFDMNLSWGAIFYEGGNPAVIEGVQATNDIHKAHPFYGSSQALALSGPGGAYNRIYDVVFDIPELRQMYLRRMRTMMDTYVKPPGTSPLLLPIEKRVRALQESMREEAVRDRAAWGWPSKGGQTNFDPGIPFDQGVEDLLQLFVELRRQHFYNRHSVLNTAFPVGLTKADNAGIPTAQPADAVVTITAVDYNPVSGNQLEEYVRVSNPNAYAVDVSGWELKGGIGFEFRPGTVIPSSGVLYVARDRNAFRDRAASPRGGQGVFVVGNYSGQLSARGESIVICDQNGRAVSTNSYPPLPSLAQQHLRITELMYNPSALVGGTNEAQSYEYIELKNIGPVTVDLAGVRFGNGITFGFPLPGPMNLGAGQTVLVVKSIDAFTERYGLGASIGGEYPGLMGFLDNAGERIVLLDRNGEEIHDFTFNNSWYPITDGLGFSLQVVDENADPDLWGSRTNWRPSGQLTGTPGAADPGAPAIGNVLVNEVLSHTDPPEWDSIELFNPTASPVDLGGWFLTDDFNDPMKYRIPDATIIEAGGYLVFDETHFNPDPGVLPGFSLSSAGEEAYLFSGEPAGSALTGYFDGFSFGASANGVPFGIHVTSVGEGQVVALESLTLLGPNSGPRVGPVVITEIMFHPPNIEGADNDLDEYIELTNISGGAVDLFNSVGAPWRLDRAVNFEFPPSTVLPAGGCLLVVGFDPADLSALADFRALHGIAPGVPIHGPWSGKLDNSSDDVELDLPEPAEGGVTAYIRVDRVVYADAAPWPAAADGFGPSLQRRVPVDFGNDPANWFAGTPTPCAPAGGVAPTITSPPSSQQVVALMDAQFSVIASGSGPLSYQWRYNGDNIAGANGPSLTVSQVIPEDQGNYSVVVHNSAGSVVSADATLTALIPATITLQPQGVSVLPGSDVTLNVGATSTTPVTFQWRKNGVALEGQTGTSLFLADVQFEDGAVYDVVVTDGIGSIVSDPAEVRILIRAFIIYPTANAALTLPVGSTVTFAVQVTNTATLPVGYRWRRGGATLANRALNTRTDFFTLTDITAADNGSYTCIITNAAFYTPGESTRSVTLTVVAAADMDGDGLPDDYETDNGLNPNDPADAAMDLDGDGISNGDEFLSMTDPQDPDSYLKIDEIIDEGVVRLRFQGFESKSYAIQFRDQAGDGPWQHLTSVVPVSVSSTATRMVEVIDPAPPVHGERYYRLLTPGVTVP